MLDNGVARDNSPHPQSAGVESEWRCEIQKMGWMNGWMQCVQKSSQALKPLSRTHLRVAVVRPQHERGRVVPRKRRHLPHHGPASPCRRHSTHHASAAAAAAGAAQPATARPLPQLPQHLAQ